MGGRGLTENDARRGCNRIESLENNRTLQCIKDEAMKALEGARRSRRRLGDRASERGPQSSRKRLFVCPKKAGTARAMLVVLIAPSLAVTKEKPPASLVSTLAPSSPRRSRRSRRRARGQGPSSTPRLSSPCRWASSPRRATESKGPPRWPRWRPRRSRWSPGHVVRVRGVRLVGRRLRTARAAGLQELQGRQGLVLGLAAGSIIARCSPAPPPTGKVLREVRLARLPACPTMNGTSFSSPRMT